jgi:beta-lactamase class C
MLGLKHTYLSVPSDQMQNYAQGYTNTDAPIRMGGGVLDAEMYGIKTTADDLLRFIEANMRILDIDEKLQAAIIDTHTGYDVIGAMTQDLVWEQYHYPVELEHVLTGNSPKIVFEPNPVNELHPPSPPQATVLINKTGSTNGFSAYVAFIPERQTGIVLLANKSYPIAARVTAAYDILSRLGGTGSEVRRAKPKSK